MKKGLVILLAALIALPFSFDVSAKEKKKKKKKGDTELVMPVPKKISAYDKLFKGKKVETARSNFITLHKVEGKLYFEIPLKYMEREFLLASTVTQVTSPEFCDIGYKANEPMHLKFTKHEPGTAAITKSGIPASVMVSPVTELPSWTGSSKALSV